MFPLVLNLLTVIIANLGQLSVTVTLPQFTQMRSRSLILKSLILFGRFIPSTNSCNVFQAECFEDKYQQVKITSKRGSDIKLRIK